MCGRLFTTRAEWREILAALGLPWMDLPELNNQAPTEQVPFIFIDNGKPVMKLMRWGLHPRFATQPPTGGATTHNARIETVSTLPTYKNALRRQRGFVPAVGFIEWRTVGKISEPFYINCEDQPLGLAGIWDVWNNEVFSFSLITQPANKTVEEIHPRMPLSLTRAQLMRWINPDEDAQQLLKEFAGQSLPSNIRPIDFAVNNTRNKGPAIFVEEHPEQAALF